MGAGPPPKKNDVGGQEKECEKERAGNMANPNVREEAVRGSDWGGRQECRDHQWLAQRARHPGEGVGKNWTFREVSAVKKEVKEGQLRQRHKYIGPNQSGPAGEKEPAQKNNCGSAEEA